jgi:hypothetical protein
VAGYNYILCCALMASFSLHFHDHAWHMHLCGALVAGITIIFCVDALVAGIAIIFYVDALVAGIISGSYSYKSMHLTHNCIESVV